MAFQTPLTIKEVLRNIEAQSYLLPAIQREVVWRKDQIVRLFDSIMLDYPIGSFLFWQVDEAHSKDFVFYEFMTHYHQKNNRHLSRHDMTSRRPIVGVLDGQQRLTALNIGLRGSYAEKLPRRWAEFDSNYPKTSLYLRLDSHAEGNDLGVVYDFRFLTPEHALEISARGAHWFNVPDVMDLDPDEGVDDYLETYQLTGKGDPTARKMLRKLERIVRTERIVNYYLEPAQDLDKVLNIFIRVNSGGTVLSQSDLLLSIAVAQWRHLDAREAIHNLVDELNAIGEGFSVSKNLVLKAGLLLNDISNVAFRVTNFNAANMDILEQNWPKVANALRHAVRLLANFGYSVKTLSADSVILPVAYYLSRINAQEAFLTSVQFANDRQRIRHWINRSLLKSGIWGSGLDQLLMGLRSVLQSNTREEFPIDAIEQFMSSRGKSLDFNAEELRVLATMSANDRRAFTFLSVLYPGMDFRNSFHIDHVYPQAKFSKSHLEKTGLGDQTILTYQDQFNRIPNLQLLEGALNMSKQDDMPHAWALKHFQNPGDWDTYRMRHMLGEVPENLADFGTFYNRRLERIVELAARNLGVALTNQE